MLVGPLLSLLALLISPDRPRWQTTSAAGVAVHCLSCLLRQGHLIPGAFVTRLYYHAGGLASLVSGLGVLMFLLIRGLVWVSSALGHTLSVRFP